MRWLALMLLLAVGDANAQVYRCTEGGRTVYSDKPCGGSSTVIAVSAPTSRDTGTNLQSEANLGRVAVGMTPAQVEIAWGRPNAVNTSTTADGRTEQWVYRRGGSDQYVYFRQGLVSSISERKSSTPEAPVVSSPPIRIQSELDAAKRSGPADSDRFLGLLKWLPCGYAAS